MYMGCLLRFALGTLDPSAAENSRLHPFKGGGWNSAIGLVSVLVQMKHTDENMSRAV